MQDMLATEQPYLTVVMPAYNETHRLPETLATLKAYLQRRFPRHEVIVVDDGSRDGTPELVRETARGWAELKLLVQPKNIGKGAAVKRGMLAATGDLVLFTDADLATPIEEVENMLPHFRNGSKSVVVGVRTYQDDGSKWRRVLGLSLQIIAHLIVFDRAVVDSQCGFKCFRRDVGRDIFERVRILGGMFDVEIFAIMHRLGTEICYQPVHWANKAGSRINILRCMFFDIIDMMAIRRNAGLGRYDRPRLVPMQRDSVPV